MPDYVVAGASSIEDIPQFAAVARQAGIAVLLLENAAMSEHIPTQHRALVTCSEDIPHTHAPVIPLNEFWVSRAIRAGVANIAPHALRASRSKHYLSARLATCGLHTLPRRYLEDVAAPYPDRYLARLDAAYSGYGIVRHVEAGHFDPMAIARVVRADASRIMRAVLDEDAARVVVEDYLDGEEYSADVFVHQGRPVVLRLFRKIVAWIGGRPVCDSYIAVPHDPALCAAIHDWCAALYSAGCTSFGQFDFIVVDGRAVAVDFSCRIGGGLGAIKRFAGIDSYAALALAGGTPSFAPFTVQKNVLARRPGRLANFVCRLPHAYQVTIHRQAGDLLPDNICSANARIAEICFAARDLDDATAMAQELDNKVSIDVHGEY
ncbi:hypothetical protein LGN20_34285 [Burkholderia cepacia]|uniref:hypothetical protein n=1 Tax=Burkholderia cepacia complex TaxID=87882 RepID=UPI001CF4AF86|nr:MULTISPECIES: hypothetical protein [Burkholderia cepacia complex]MCA8218996.1 hypothetical protein [Burkholderia cepacia]MCA8232094.1 hypothetical protein [Burkholderia vietnamiensis]